MLLALDTATACVSVALHDGARVVAEHRSVDAMRHGERLAPAITEVLERARATRGDLTAIAVGVGPGPFTGLRVGVVTARTLGAVLEVPVYGVCTLDVLAAQAVEDAAASQLPGLDGGFLVAGDARRREVHWAAYDPAGVRLEGPHVAAPGEVATDRPVVGQGAVLYPEHFPSPWEPTYPSAGVLARALAEERVAPLDPEPLYLRRPDAAGPHRPKRVS